MRPYLKTTLITIMLLAALKNFSQNTNNNMPDIKWDNGNVTFLKDLGKVWINTKSGSVLKNVRIWSIESAKGKLTYDKDGSLHDLLIGKIENIITGKNSRSILYFDNENLPRIKSSHSYLFGEEISSDFFISKKAEVKITEEEEKTEVKNPEAKLTETKTLEVKVEEEKTQTIQSLVKLDTLIVPKFNSINLSNTTPSDTIVKTTGEMVPAKVISNTLSEVRYKRLDNLQGPIYSLTKSKSTVTIKYTNNIKVIFK